MLWKAHGYWVVGRMSVALSAEGDFLESFHSADYTSLIHPTRAGFKKVYKMWKYVIGYIVFIVVASSISKAWETPETRARRAEVFYNANKSLASELTCDASQEASNPDECASMAAEKFDELQKRSEIYHE